MKFCRSFSLAITLACFLGGRFSDVFAADPVKQAKSEPSASEMWKQIVSARAALDQAIATDLATLSPENRAAAGKRVADQASKLEDISSEFSNDFPSDTNLLRAVAHGAYAMGIEGVLERPNLLWQAADHITGVEFESELTKDVPVLGNYAKAYREECERNLVAGTIAALRFHPTNNSVCAALLHLAQKTRSDGGKLLVRELITNSLLPAAWMDSAKNILNRRFSIGQPFDMKFSGIGGREADSQKLRGKVLLVNFWATSCPPCIGEIPELKSLYKQYRNQGFEVVGVSLDDEAKPVLKLIHEKGVSWPILLAVGGMKNDLVSKCGFFAIPNNWLVDKQGILREIAAERGSLEKKIIVLLAESP